MKKYFLLSLLAPLALLGISCPQIGPAEPQYNGQNPDVDAQQLDNRSGNEEAINPADPADRSDPQREGSSDQEASSQGQNGATSFNGTILAAGQTPFIEFNQTDYENALNANKVVLLNFYANWCPLCKRQEPVAIEAFGELNNPNVVAFRVNYNDTDTSDEEVSVARRYGVSYQDTKVVVAGGQRVAKSPEFWDKDRYLEEIGAHL